MLLIAPEQCTQFIITLAPPHLPDLTILLTMTGCEVRCHSGATDTADLEQCAHTALTQMRKLTLLPGPQVTVDTTMTTAEVVAVQVDAAI